MAQGEQQLMQMMRQISPQPGMFDGTPPDPQRLLTQGPDVIKRIKKKRPEHCSDQFKVQASQFFLGYYHMRMFSLAPINDPMQGPQDPDPRELEIFKSDQCRDMEYAFRLLNSNFASRNFRMQAWFLKLEIAQRLESSTRIAEAVTEYYENLDDFSEMPEAKTVIFTAVPLIGRWENFIEIGNQLPPQAFEHFSTMAAQMPIPDYTILYNLSKEVGAQEREIPDPETLGWDQFHISSIRVKFRDLNCEEFEDKRQELLQEIQSSEENVKWEDVPDPNRIHLRRLGAIYQCISFSESPQQLCGIFENDRIYVKGKTQAMMGPPDIDPELILSGQVEVDPSSLALLFQEEVWDLTRSEDNPQLYTGTYEMHNYTPVPDGETITDPDQAPLHMWFDLELTICTAEEFAQFQLNQVNEDNLESRIVTEFDDLELD